ncbi:hypothetical protein D3C81_1665080 [compost metagenome]
MFPSGSTLTSKIQSFIGGTTTVPEVLFLLNQAIPYSNPDSAEKRTSSDFFSLKFNLVVLEIVVSVTLEKIIATANTIKTIIKLAPFFLPALFTILSPLYHPSSYHGFKISFNIFTINFYI